MRSRRLLVMRRLLVAPRLVAMCRLVVVRRLAVTGSVVIALQCTGWTPGRAELCPAAGGWPDEISGMALLGERSLLLVDDEERRCCFLLDPRRLGDPDAQPEPTPLPLRLDDLEAATSDSAGWTYLLTSHSLTRKGKLRPDRRLLVRLAVKGSAEQPPGVVEPTVIDDLLARIGDPDLADRSPNLEGLAWYPGGDRLLIGARSPLRSGRALVFAIGPARALFAGEPVTCQSIELDLGGRGIRGMEYDPWRKGCLILAGGTGSALDPGATGSAVYLWSAATGEDRLERFELVELAVTGLETLPQPEAICGGGPVDEEGAGPLIIATEGVMTHGAPVQRLHARPRRGTGER